MAKFVLDCFGGDHSPQANVEGAVMALSENADVELVLTGDAEKIKAELAKYEYDASRVEIVHAPDVIGCDEKPTEAIKKRKESSLVRAVELLKETPDIQGMISIGSTGVVLVGGVLRIGRIRGIARPAFCPLLPTMNGGVVGVCDSGANMDCTPEMLLHFAMMGSLHLENVWNIERPRVALLNDGIEEGKGDELHKSAYALLKDTPAINFVGNMESRDLLTGKFDLVVCDGFSGNVLIKSTEGTAMEMLKMIKRNIASGGASTKLGALLMKKMLMKTKDFMDYRNYGGSPMLGTKRIIVKGHGSANAVSVKICIDQAYRMYKCGLTDAIAHSLEMLPKRDTGAAAADVSVSTAS